MIGLIRHWVAGVGMKAVVATVALGALPVAAMAENHYRADVDVDVETFPAPVVVDREVRVWVQPVYRTVAERRWVEPVYRIVSERVFVPDRYEVREIVDVGYYHRRVIREQ